jgi:hypothetical protein
MWGCNNPQRSMRSHIRALPYTREHANEIDTDARTVKTKKMKPVSECRTVNKKFIKIDACLIFVIQSLPSFLTSCPVDETKKLFVCL